MLSLSLWPCPSLRYINRLANEYSGGAEKNALVGSSVTLADAQLYHFLSIFDDTAAVARAVERFPIVKASRANFGQLPEIQAWVAKRPQTPW